MRNETKLLCFALAIAPIAGMIAPGQADHRFATIIGTVFIMLLAIPSFYAVIKREGRRGAITVLTLCALAILIETIAIKTGYPYGEFSYGETMGYKLFGTTPFTVAFAWPPLVLGAYALARGRIVLATLFLVMIDLAIDTGAVAMGYWAYTGGGIYFGVPLSNFLGWVLTGFLGLYLVSTLLKKPSMDFVASYALILFFWTGVLLALGLWIAFVISVLITVLVAYVSKKGFLTQSNV